MGVAFAAAADGFECWWLVTPDWSKPY